MMFTGDHRPREPRGSSGTEQALDAGAEAGVEAASEAGAAVRPGARSGQWVLFATGRL